MPTVEITNTDRGPRGVNTADGLVMLAPGETRALDVHEGELADMPAYLSRSAPSLADMRAAIANPAEALTAMTVPALRTLAEERGIKLPETGTGGDGRVLKSDIVAAILAGPKVEPAGDTLDAMDDETLRATVQALTGVEPAADLDRDALLALARAG